MAEKKPSNGQARKAAAAEVAALVPQASLAPLQLGKPRRRAFDPLGERYSDYVARDPTWRAYKFYWADKQQRGRLAYDVMLQHAAVSTPRDALVAFLKSFKPIFKPPTSDASDRQQMFADFANEQLRRLGQSGDPRSGYEKLVDWFGQGLDYGFALSEMEVILEPWRGVSRKQINRVVALPQASLDCGYQPLEEFGHGFLTNFGDVRYKCFTMDSRGDITAIHQFYSHAGREDEIIWQGDDLNSILHFVHGGGQGNPYGCSIMYAAFQHWGRLYTLELMEDAQMDAGQPFLGVSYKTPDGRPSPALHEAVEKAFKDRNPDTPVIVAPDTTFTSVALANKEFTEQSRNKAAQERRYITESMLVPNVLYGESSTTKTADTRNLVYIFFKHFIPAILKEMGTLLTWQFSRRLIDSNWVKLTDEDYPVCDFQVFIEEDLRAASALLLQAFPFVDSERMGEFLATMIPGGVFDPAFIPKDHKDSISAKRQPPATDGQPASPPGTPGGGGKEPGQSEDPPSTGQNA